MIFLQCTCGDDSAIWRKDTTGRTHEATLWSCCLELQTQIVRLPKSTFYRESHREEWRYFKNHLRKFLSITSLQLKASCLKSGLLPSNKERYDPTKKQVELQPRQVKPESNFMHTSWTVHIRSCADYLRCLHNVHNLL